MCRNTLSVLTSISFFLSVDAANIFKHILCRSPLWLGRYVLDKLFLYLLFLQNQRFICFFLCLFICLFIYFFVYVSFFLYLLISSFVCFFLPVFPPFLPRDNRLGTQARNCGRERGLEERYVPCARK